MLESVSDDETILYKSPRIVNKKATNIMFILALLGFNLFILMLIFIPIFSEIGIIGTSIIMGGFNVILIPLIYLVLIRSEKKTCYFLLSDNKLWLYTFHKHTDMINPLKRKIEFYFIKSINGIIFRKRFLDKNKNSGTIEFLSNHITPKKIGINNIPHMNTLQIIIESIFFHYGNIQEKWEDFTKENMSFPQTYEISEVKLAKVKKFVLISGLVLISILPICYILSFIINNIIATVTIFSIGFVFVIMLLLPTVTTIYRTSIKGDKLKFDKNAFSLKSKEREKIVILDKYVTFNIKRSIMVNDFDSMAQGITKNYDYIKISESYKSKIFIKFGPFTKLPYIIDLISVYLIIWKSNHGHLFSKDDLIKENQN